MYNAISSQLEFGECFSTEGFLSKSSIIFEVCSKARRCLMYPCNCKQVFLNDLGALKQSVLWNLAFRVCEPSSALKPYLKLLLILRRKPARKSRLELITFKDLSHFWVGRFPLKHAIFCGVVWNWQWAVSSMELVRSVCDQKSVGFELWAVAPDATDRKNHKCGPDSKFDWGIRCVTCLLVKHVTCHSYFSVIQTFQDLNSEL